jgi:WD40 repeat protein/class 3 adenylate cyclase
MSDLPDQTHDSRSGVVTLVFTDVVGSTALKQQLGDKAGVELLQRHHELLRQALAQFAAAREINTAGDSFFLLFPTPSAAVSFALLFQMRLQEFNSRSQKPVQDRIGIHLGEVTLEGGEQPVDLHGLSVDLCARVMSLAGPGQILMTRPVFDNARQSLKGAELQATGALSWLNHGRFELKGIDEPVDVCEVRSSAAAHLVVPTTSEKARRVEVEGEAVLGWRPAVGQVVPNTRWVLEEKLGEGGFGEVWLGRHQMMKERRVFKFCFRADRVRSLKREMTLFRLIKERFGDHPNIVALREVYFEQPPFYVEEDYVAGSDLASWCAAHGGPGKVILETKLEIVAQVADALQAAHDAGVIHRDVKPANILVASSKDRPQPSTLNPQPLAKLTDFGIGQVTSEEALVGVTRAGFTRTMMSSSSSQSGTQLYMAPELLAGQPASTRSDIYSLGVVLFQLLVGDFRRPVTTDWTRNISDPLLRQDLTLCFAGEPQERFAGAGQLAQNLRSLSARRVELDNRERLERQSGRRRLIGLVSAGVTLVLLAIAMALGYGLRQAKAQALAARQNLYAADMATVQRALAEGNRGLARRLLEAHRPQGGEEDLRGFEWRYLWQQSQGDQFWTFRGHSNSISWVAWSPDGKVLASVSRNGDVRLWDIPNRKPLAVLSNSAAGSAAIAFATHGKILGATSSRGVRLWDLSTLRVVRDIPTPRPALPLAFVPGRAWLAVGMGDSFASGLGGGDTVLYDIATGKELRTLPKSGGRTLAFSGDGTQLATGPSEGQIKLWDPATGTELATIPDVGRLLSLALSPDGRRLAASHWDGQVSLWDPDAIQARKVLAGHETVVWSIAFSPSGQSLATVSSDQTVRLWDLAACGEQARLLGHGHEVWSVAFSPGGEAIASGSHDETVMLWSTTPKADTSFAVDGSERIRGVPFAAFSPDGRLIAARAPGNSIAVWQVDSGMEVGRFLNTPNGVLRFLEGGRTLATIDPKGALDLWDLRNQQHRQVVRNGPTPGSPPIDLSPDGTLLAENGNNGRVLLRNTVSGAVVRDWQAHDAGVYGLKFSPDGRLLATGSAGAEPKLWVVATGRMLVMLPRAHKDGVEGFDFFPDGQRLATASWDSSVRVWGVPSGHVLFSLFGHKEGAYSVSVSPDGRTLASAARSGCLWNLATQREVMSLAGADAVAFAPDGKALAFLTPDPNTRVSGKLHVWHAPSFAEIETLEKARGRGASNP